MEQNRVFMQMKKFGKTKCRLLFSNALINAFATPGTAGIGFTTEF